MSAVKLRYVLLVLLVVAAILEIVALGAPYWSSIPLEMKNIGLFMTCEWGFCTSVDLAAEGVLETQVGQQVIGTMAACLLAVFATVAAIVVASVHTWRARHKRATAIFPTIVCALGLVALASMVAAIIVFYRPSVLYNPLQLHVIGMSGYLAMASCAFCVAIAVVALLERQRVLFKIGSKRTHPMASLDAHNAAPIPRMRGANGNVGSPPPDALYGNPNAPQHNQSKLPPPAAVAATQAGAPPPKYPPPQQQQPYGGYGQQYPPNQPNQQLLQRPQQQPYGQPQQPPPQQYGYGQGGQPPQGQDQSLGRSMQATGHFQAPPQPPPPPAYGGGYGAPPPPSQQYGQQGWGQGGSIEMFAQ